MRYATICFLNLVRKATVFSEKKKKKKKEKKKQNKTKNKKKRRKERRKEKATLYVPDIVTIAII